MYKMLKKLNLPTIGFLQAIGVALYCGLLSVFFWTMDKTRTMGPGIITWLLLLLLLVFSAAITGFLVFGYPAYLAMQKKIRAALTVLGTTLLTSLVIIVIIIFIVSVARLS